MRVQFPTSLVAVLAAASLTASLAACAHGAVRASVAEGGEVALGPAAASATSGSTFAPIGLTELSGRVEATPTAALATRSLATPALATRSASPTDGGVELWQGSYVGRTYGQRGAIALALRPAGASVRGTVAWRVRSERATLGRVGRDTVALVRAPIVSAARDAGQLVLHLDAYFDPSCNCTSRATFRGALRGDTLVGRFSVEGPATVVSEDRGRWQAVRVMP